MGLGRFSDCNHPFASLWNGQRSSYGLLLRAIQMAFSSDQTAFKSVQKSSSSLFQLPPQRYGIRVITSSNLLNLPIYHALLNRFSDHNI